jgi:alpha-galactosidase
MTSKNRTVDGKPTSLLEVGYSNCGIDDGWQACGTGLQDTYHDNDGNPLINTTLFPDFSKLVQYAHSKDMKLGWYGNNCECRDNSYPHPEKAYEGDVKVLTAAGFDGLKLDNCGQYTNLTLYAELINKSGHAVLTENCHWGQTVPKTFSKSGKLLPHKQHLYNEAHLKAQLPHWTASGELHCPYNVSGGEEQKTKRI